MVKRLSANDTNSGIHQAGIFVSSENEIVKFFPELDENTMNPRAEILLVDDEGIEWPFNFIHYNNKIVSDGTRNEYRLTGMTTFLKRNSMKEGCYLFLWKESEVWRISCTKLDEIKKEELPSSGWKCIYLEEIEVTLENSEDIQIMDTDEGYNEEPDLWDIKDTELRCNGVVRVNRKDYSVYELYRKSKKDHQKLYMDVPFQRNRVWNNRQKIELIESIMLGLPLPIFYFKQENDASLSVIDGKQRLSAIFSYMRDEYKLNRLKILTFLNGKKYSDLTGDFAVYQTQLEDFQLYSHVIMPPTPDRYIFEIFGRVNRAGTKLNKQEIRNAMYHGPGMELIKHIAESDIFEKATGISYQKDKRMKNQYMLTRFISFYFLRNGNLKIEENGKFVPYIYDGHMDFLLEKGLRRLNALPSNELHNLENVICRALDLAYNTMGKRAFRRYALERNPLNQILFEIEMYCFAKYSEENYMQDSRYISDRIIKAAKDEKFNEYLDRSRDNKNDVNKRFTRFLDVFYDYREGSGI